MEKMKPGRGRGRVGVGQESRAEGIMVWRVDRWVSWEVSDIKAMWVRVKDGLDRGDHKDKDPAAEGCWVCLRSDQTKPRRSLTVD